MSLHAESGAALAAAPSLSRRMACFVYEGLILFGMLLVPAAIGATFNAFTGQRYALRMDAPLGIISIVMYAMYFAWFWSARGQTLPMQTWRIRVVGTDGAPLSHWRALTRHVASYAWFGPAVLLASLNGWKVGVGLNVAVALVVGVIAYALLALLHPQRQFWHDALCGTRLIQEQPPASV